MTLIINGEPVGEEALSQEFSNIKSYHQQQGGISCCERDGEFRSAAQENVIARTLLSQEARRSTEPSTPAEVDEALRKIQEEHGGRDRFFAEFNLTPEQEPQVRRDLESSLRVQKMLERLCAADPDPSEEELRGFYERNLARFMNPERVRASHLLKRLPRGGDRSAAYDELRRIRELLLEGADFHRTALEHSDNCKPEPGAPPPDAAKGDGVDLGLFARGEIVEEFELVAFSLRVGEVSPVFVTPYGYHLVQVTERRPATPKPFEEAKGQVTEQYLNERRQEKVRLFVQDLRSRATIEGLEPPAESSHAHP